MDAALYLAVKNKDGAAEKKLLKAGASIDAALKFAYKECDTSAVQRLKNAKGPKAVLSFKELPLRQNRTTHSPRIKPFKR